MTYVGHGMFLGCAYMAINVQRNESRNVALSPSRTTPLVFRMRQLLLVRVSYRVKRKRQSAGCPVLLVGAK